jgi:hypothetical protein
LYTSSSFTFFLRSSRMRGWSLKGILQVSSKFCLARQNSWSRRALMATTQCTDNSIEVTENIGGKQRGLTGGCHLLCHVSCQLVALPFPMLKCCVRDVFPELLLVVVSWNLLMVLATLLRLYHLCAYMYSRALARLLGSSTGNQVSKVKPPSEFRIPARHCSL